MEEINNIFLGAAPNDGTGDEIRVGGDIINANFTELDRRSRPQFGYNFKCKGSQGGVPNIAISYEKGDIFFGKISIDTYVNAAMWKGNNLEDTEDYILLSWVTIDEENQI